MKKRILAVLLATTLALAMAGCGGGSSSGGSTKSDAPAEETKKEETETEKETAAEDDKGGEEEAVKDAGAQTAEASSYEELVPVMSYEEYAAAAVKDPVTVETYVQARQAYDAGQSTANLYTQNEEGACFISNMKITQADYDRLVEGQKIRISGYKGEEAGEVMIQDATYEIEDGNYIAEAADVTDLLGTDGLADYMNRKILIRDVKSVDTEDLGGDLFRFLYDTDGNGDPGDDLYFSIEKDGKTYLLVVESSLCGPDTDVYKAVESVEEDAMVDLEGFLYWNDGPAPHITGMTIH